MRAGRIKKMKIAVAEAVKLFVNTTRKDFIAASVIQMNLKNNFTSMKI